eukprot:COSAG02_NODE_11652_length_1681_cov_1.192162_2_plen_48_part_01
MATVPAGRRADSPRSSLVLHALAVALTLPVPLVLAAQFAAAAVLRLVV